MTAIPLGQCLHIASSNLPDGEPDIALRCYRFREQPALPSLFGFAPGVVCHAVSVAGPAVALTAPFHPCRAETPKGEGGRFILCGTVPGVAPPDVIRHRMSMEPGLSSPAAFRP